jgi:hypothetical protein
MFKAYHDKTIDAFLPLLLPPGSREVPRQVEDLEYILWPMVEVADSKGFSEMIPDNFYDIFGIRSDSDPCESFPSINF